MNVAEMTVHRAAAVKRLGAPNVVEAVERGEASVYAAFDAVRTAPKETQETWKPKDILRAAQSVRKPRRKTPEPELPTPAEEKVTRPSGNLMFCQFLLSEITEPAKVAKLQEHEFGSTWNDLLEEASRKPWPSARCHRKPSHDRD